MHKKITGGRVVFESQVNVLVDSESKVTSGRKVFLLQLILLHLESSVKNLIGFESTDLKRRI